MTGCARSFHCVAASKETSFSHKSSSVLRLLLQMTFFMFDVFKDSHHGIKLRLIKDKTHNSQIVKLYYKHVTEKNR